MLTKEEMKNIPQIPFEKHLYTKELKTKWWGEGEWTEELDFAIFIHEGIQCIIRRMAIPEPYTEEEHIFGGYLNGYCMIPKEHPQYKKGEDLFDFEYDIHGGITYNEIEENEEHWIGFDCAHSTDLTPSLETLKKRYPPTFDINKEFPLPEKFKDYAIFNPTYRNWSFVLGETKSLAEQIKKDIENNQKDGGKND